MHTGCVTWGAAYWSTQSDTQTLDCLVYVGVWSSPLYRSAFSSIIQKHGCAEYCTLKFTLHMFICWRIKISSGSNLHANTEQDSMTELGSLHVNHSDEAQVDYTAARMSEINKSPSLWQTHHTLTVMSDWNWSPVEAGTDWGAEQHVSFLWPASPHRLFCEINVVCSGSQITFRLAEFSLFLQHNCFPEFNFALRLETWTDIVE